MAGIDVATGTTITFATDALTLGVTGMKIGAVSVPVVDTTVLNPTLATTGQDGAATSRPGRIQHLGPITVEVQFDPAVAKRVKLGTVQTVTITFYTGETLAGSGYISEKGEVSLDQDGLMRQTLTVQRSGVWA